MVVSSFAIGALAVPIFNLGFVESALTIIFINILGILPVCFFSTFGPQFGLRQMVLSRFFFGYYGVKLGELVKRPFIVYFIKEIHWLTISHAQWLVSTSWHASAGQP